MSSKRMLLDRCHRDKVCEPRSSRLPHDVVLAAQRPRPKSAKKRQPTRALCAFHIVR